MRTPASIALLMIVSAPFASSQVFTDRAQFDSALGGTSLEDFEDEALSGNTSNGASVTLTFTDFKVDTVPAAAKVLNVPAFGAQNTTPGGAKYLYLDTDIGLQGSATTFTFTHPTRGFGFQYTSVDQGGTTFDATINGQTFPITLNSIGGPSLFWGFVSATPFSTALVATSTESGYGIDDVAYDSGCNGPVTLPFGAGCVGSGGFVPALAGDLCANVGSLYTVTVQQALGGSTAFVFLGASQGATPIADCTYLLLPILPPFFGIPLGGVGPGNGILTLTTTIPLTVPTGLAATVQFLIADSGVPRGFSATNGLAMTFNP